MRRARRCWRSAPGRRRWRRRCCGRFSTAWRRPRDFHEMRILAFAVLGLFVLRGLATYGALVVLSRTGNRIVATVQARVFDHLLRQNMLYFQDRHSSEFIARLSLAANGVRDALAGAGAGPGARRVQRRGPCRRDVLARPADRQRSPYARCRSPRLFSAGSSAACALSPNARSTARRRSCRRWAKRCLACASSKPSISKTRCASAWTRRSASSSVPPIAMAAGGAAATLLADSLAGSGDRLCDFLRFVARQRRPWRRRRVRLLSRRVAACL